MEGINTDLAQLLLLGKCQDDYGPKKKSNEDSEQTADITEHTTAVSVTECIEGKSMDTVYVIEHDDGGEDVQNVPSFETSISSSHSYASSSARTTKISLPKPPVRRERRLTKEQETKISEWLLFADDTDDEVVHRVKDQHMHDYVTIDDDYYAVDHVAYLLGNYSLSVTESLWERTTTATTSSSNSSPSSSSASPPAKLESVWRKRRRAAALYDGRLWSNEDVNVNGYPWSQRDTDVKRTIDNDGFIVSSNDNTKASVLPRDNAGWVSF